jgi:hypothetical protein
MTAGGDVGSRRPSDEALASAPREVGAVDVVEADAIALIPAGLTRWVLLWDWLNAAAGRASFVPGGTASRH